MLKALPMEARSVITEKVDALFGELEVALDREVMAWIDEEERNIEDIAELNMREQADKGQADLAEYAAAVSAHRRSLARALTISRQI
jgi:hypothetical protein